MTYCMACRKRKEVGTGRTDLVNDFVRYRKKKRNLISESKVTYNYSYLQEKTEEMLFFFKKICIN